MATRMDEFRGASDSKPRERLDRSYRELEAVLEQSDLEREAQLAEAVIDAIDAVEKARTLAGDRPDNGSFSWGIQ
ncbi:hypothetical protein RH831_02710 [Halodesulfurarchaeum sp. HSR-GB]|uniref:hypothetical protein n=1 Tax=Halodesulfurarchaeum sp. HSR-GB TaxID=3074077 RepID=UPI002860369C|nr:hypothetical protein [Halodesulfurarchaeum sp. HSR-GB]MDR5656090.1 hypothetical protein [Halodesulfurarchaeum sp. HSR-GB]